MMIAGQPFAGHLPQHATDHGAQRFLHDFVIGNQAVGRAFTHRPVVNAWRFAVKTLRAEKGSL